MPSTEGRGPLVSGPVFAAFVASSLAALADPPRGPARAGVSCAVCTFNLDDLILEHLCTLRRLTPRVAFSVMQPLQTFLLSWAAGG